MFNKTQLDAYSSIKAPDELFDKVIKSRPSKSKIYLIPLVSSLAACLVLIFGVAAFANRSFTPDVTIDGNKLTAESLIISDGNFPNAVSARSAVTLRVPVELNLSEKTHISVSDGSMVFEDGKNSEEVKLKGEVSFVWEIEFSAQETQHIMTLDSFSGTNYIYLTQYPDGSYTAKIN